jgi:hypothetical protein
VLLDATSVAREPKRQAVVEAIKPPQHNFARLCLRCGERDCERPECIAWHERSAWAVCPDCGGEEWTDTYEPCGCLSGVVEAWPKQAMSARSAAA